MADFRQQQHQQRPGGQGFASTLPGKGPSTSQVLAVVTLLSVGGSLLFLSGLTLVGTLIGLALTTPVFVIFSPVLVPTALVIGLGVLGFLASGALGVTALSSLSWMANYLHSSIRGPLTQTMDQAKRKAEETAGKVGQKGRETAQTVQGKATEAAKGGPGPEVSRT
ncbi:PREDICTED: oleosin 16.4 kDa-like [Populus euphratica]|uniref:Oleosin 16.4 kDa-like n=1 Tax=Populus euphratica TaxID=75702 RepID=A0AAJ6VG69_POPEU|nr:PREDICTED: oleosin 16.4 kDa-like [Populus euphratica]XP_011047823.1 PREDICTED: oleosin 16.4 kDa-like [Populus euphratica]